MQAHTNKQVLYVRIKQSFALLAQTDLGSEYGLPRLGDHVELLDGGGQVAGGAQVGQAHEAALCPHVIVRPVVPLVRCVRGCKRKSSGFTTVKSCISRKNCHTAPPAGVSASLALVPRQGLRLRD